MFICGNGSDTYDDVPASDSPVMRFPVSKSLCHLALAAAGCALLSGPWRARGAEDTDAEKKPSFVKRLFGGNSGDKDKEKKEETKTPPPPEPKKSSKPKAGTSEKSKSKDKASDKP